MRAAEGLTPYPRSLAAIRSIRQKYRPVLHFGPTQCTILEESQDSVRFRVAGHDFVTSVDEDEFYMEQYITGFLDKTTFHPEFDERRRALIYARYGVSPYYN